MRYISQLSTGSSWSREETGCKIQHEQVEGNSKRGRLRVPTGLRRRVRAVEPRYSVRVSNQYGWRDAEECTRTSRTDTGFECRLNINLPSRGQRLLKVLIRTRSR